MLETPRRNFRSTDLDNTWAPANIPYPFGLTSTMRHADRGYNTRMIPTDHIIAFQKW